MANRLPAGNRIPAGTMDDYIAPHGIPKSVPPRWASPVFSQKAPSSSAALPAPKQPRHVHAISNQGTLWANTTVPLTAGMLGASVATLFVPHAEKAGWVGPTPIDTPFRDALQRSSEEDRALHSRISDFGIIVNSSIPLAGYGLMALASASHRGQPQLDRTMVGAQAVLGNLLTTFALKTTVGRQRPMSHYGHDSFPSGHSSSTFTGAFLILGDASPFSGEGMEAWRYGLGSVALVTATATATLRMSAGRHYLSDVLFGAGMGFFFGYLYPKLSRVEQGSDPPMITPVVEPLHRDGPSFSLKFPL